MSSQSKHTTLYSATDIQRYLKGELSAQEMHQLEKAALEDPFLADALDGLEKHPAASQDAHFDDLRTRLDSRVADPAKPKPLFFRAPWMRAAAVLILLIGLGFTAWYTLLNGSSKLKVAKTEQVAHSAAPVTAEPAVPAPASQNPDNAAADSTSVSTALAKPRQPVPANIKLWSTTAKTSSATARSDERNAKRNEVKGELEEARGKSEEARSKLEEAKDKPDEAKTISALTIDTASLRSIATSDKAPVASSPTFRSESREARAFMLRPDTTSYKLEKKADGFYYDKVESHPIVVVAKVPDIHKNTLPGASTGNIVHLQPQNNALDEVVVIGYGSKRKEVRAFAPSLNTEKVDYLWQKAQPVIGRIAYLDYLEAGKKTIGADSTIKGTVIISFDVNKKGALTAFKVEQSLTPAHDAGIIRLVSEGSAWKVTRGRSVRAAVRVVF